MQRDIFDYMHVKPLPNSIAVIPYFGGESSAVHASRAPNLVWYLKTHASMSQNFTRVLTFVQNAHDYNLVKLLPGSPEVIQIDCNPIHLPVAALESLQGDKSFDFIFYTEADQILYCADLLELAGDLDRGSYLMPWRFTRIHPYCTFPTIKHGEVCPVVQFDGKLYEIRHYLKRKRDQKYFVIDDILRAFSGCWLATRKCFKNIKFERKDELPIEWACLSLFEGKKPLRTSAPFDMFCEHLSGFEQVLRDKKMSINDLPGGW